jgi:hypothetical protein
MERFYGIADLYTEIPFTREDAHYAGVNNSTSP